VEQCDGILLCLRSLRLRKIYNAIEKITARVAADETIIYATETKKLLEHTKGGLKKLLIDVDLILAGGEKINPQYESHPPH